MTLFDRYKPFVYGAILIIALLAPFAAPGYINQFTALWILMTLALTWDTMGGQMGYNSFGNIIFFGVGMYASCMMQVGLFMDIADYTSAQGAAALVLTIPEYFTGLTAGIIAAAIVAPLFAIVIGAGMLSLRGHYFAIGTLGLGIAFGEIFSGWELVGAGSGMVTPLYPGEMDQKYIFYFLAFALTVATFFALRRLYAGRFGLAINAIRDDEDKAEAMGLPTVRIKVTCWTCSAFFIGIAGAIMGNNLRFIDPLDVAFSGPTFGVWMILMVILGGKGRIWGAFIGAIVFQFTKELFWTYFLGWQQVALGAMIVVIVVYFPTGILGWLQDNYPHLFGQKVEEKEADA